MSNSTLYPDVLKIKTNCYEIKFYKNAISLLFTIFQIHHLATLLPGCPSHRVARYGFINKKMAFFEKFCLTTICFYFQNIWIQCRIWHILSAVKQILELTFLVKTVQNFFLKYESDIAFYFLDYKIRIKKKEKKFLM